MLHFGASESPPVTRESRDSGFGDPNGGECLTSVQAPRTTTKFGEASWSLSTITISNYLAV